ncbi:hypothetical protein SAMN05216376_101545 [Mameliella alba]|uniref:hypothetical protein n=1 Tax=Mameliella alba TaxID=561184 RepID=UPI00088C3F16|nr:hypothetical protein [Mameliella alba]OWV50003.1 hypothetical protein CDZ96_00430 [Mameliella alba]PTR42620.1 hypothetical protein LX94_00543 [Mameliella alba]GGF72359.1 hypothetical protein GCM10011319_36230 [Mameliella alba]SDC18017.1 hypothetical protein SAMN05216376_101545 [Mameliella alba]
MSKGDASDPKGLMVEAYAMEGLTAEECRSIFLDWALSAPDGADMQVLIGGFLARYGENADHPMTQVLREGLEQAQKPRRRGGWKSRPRPSGEA